MRTFKPGLHRSHRVFLLQMIATILEKVNCTRVLSLQQLVGEHVNNGTLTFHTKGHRNLSRRLIVTEIVITVEIHQIMAPSGVIPLTQMSVGKTVQFLFVRI